MTGTKDIVGNMLKGRFNRIQTLFAGKTDNRPLRQEQSPSLSTQFLDIFKTMAVMEVVLIILIAVIIGFCLLFFFLAILRRLYNARKYAILDDLRSTQLSLLNEYIQEKAPLDQYSRQFAAHPGSMKWLALEHNLFLLMDNDATREMASQLFLQLGYVDYYKHVLKGRKVIARAAAISKLGRMGNPHSSKMLLTMLDTENPEIIAVTVRAISKLGDAPSLSALLTRLPGLLQKNLITKKTIDSSLVAAGSGILPVLLDFGKTCQDAAVIASLLAVVNDFPATRDVCDYAVTHLTHNDAEVRAKAVKLMVHCEENLCYSCDEAMLPLLADPVWFVRLQAVRALGRRKEEKYAQAIAALVLDEKWQVRNEAALALTLLGKGAINAFLTLLRSNDRYARESVCEEMEKADFVTILLDLLEGHEEAEVDKAREILRDMVSCGFTTQLADYLVNNIKPACVAEIRAILAGAAL